MTGVQARELAEWRKITISNVEDCWIWKGAKLHGYGVTSHKKLDKYAHRWMYKKLIGPIPKELCVDHLCRNRACVNPFHMELVSIGVNVMRGDTIPSRNAKKTHCPNGHPFDEIHTYLRRDRGGKGRHCRTCSNERRRILRRNHEQSTGS